MKKSKKLYLYSFFFISFFVFTISACTNSTSSEDQEHSEPEGFLLVMNGQTIVEQLPDEELTGSIELTSGEETPLITIHFLDHDRERFQPEEDHYHLMAEFIDEGIAVFEQHEEDGKWSFHIQAETEGTTNLTLKLMHGDHADFESQPIHVLVEAAQ